MIVSSYKKIEGQENSPIVSLEMSIAEVLCKTSILLNRELEGSEISVTVGYNSDDTIDMIRLRKNNSGVSIKDDDVYNAKIKELEKEKKYLIEENKQLTEMVIDFQDREQEQYAKVAQISGTKIYFDDSGKIKRIEV